MPWARAVTRWVLALLYALAGLLHLLVPRPFLGIMPTWVPAPELVIALTGICLLYPFDAADETRGCDSGGPRTNKTKHTQLVNTLRTNDNIQHIV